MRKINYGKYEQILEMKHNHTPESQIITDLKCSYSTIRQALEWEHQGKIKPTTVSTTPKISSKSSEKHISLDSSIKQDQKILIQLFYRSLDIKEFEKSVTDQEAEAITRLEALQ